MKKLLILVALALPLVLFAQEYKQRAPKAIETRRVAGISEYLQDGPRYGILYLTPIPEQIVTNSDTNSIVIFQSTSALTNAFLQLLSPTNRSRYAFTAVARGHLTMVLTTSNLAGGVTAGPGFSDMTNGVQSTYTLPTNSSALVICTGTNYLVVPGTK